MKRYSFIFFIVVMVICNSIQIFPQGYTNPSTHYKTKTTQSGIEMSLDVKKDVPGLAVYYWDSVGSYPKDSTTVHVAPLLPNTKGIGTGQPPGCDGWCANDAYNAVLNTLSDSIERYPGHTSLHLILNPFYPAPVYDSQLEGLGASNYRSEVSLNPWHYLYAVPSELWLSWSYYFPTVYAGYDSWMSPTDPADTSGEGLIHQLHASQGHPQIEIWQYASPNPTYFSNRLLLRVYYGDANSPTEYYYTSGQYPIAGGQWMDFIEHVEWATDTTGLYELWCITGGDTTKVFTYKGPNAYSDPEDGNPPYGGTPKLGIYHYCWHTKNPVYAKGFEAVTGLSQMELYLGPVSMIYNLPGQYDSNGFNDVYLGPSVPVDTIEPTNFISGPSQENALTVFPNPVKDKIFLSFGMANKGLAKLYDAEGNKLFESAVDDGSFIDVSLYPQGVYILYFKSVNKVTFKKIIKIDH